VVTGVIALDIVLPAIVATPIATALTRLVAGSGPIYGHRTFAVGSDVVLLAPALLGMLAGLAGPAFMALLAYGETWFRKLSLPAALRAALGGLAVGALAIELPQVTGNGYEAIDLILVGRMGLGLILVLLFGKALATTASVSSGSPGGVFTPSLFLGAALGGAFGHLRAHVGAAAAVDAVQGYAHRNGCNDSRDDPRACDGSCYGLRALGRLRDRVTATRRDRHGDIAIQAASPRFGLR
jgi:chloride channel protein, CIC family